MSAYAKLLLRRSTLALSIGATAMLAIWAAACGGGTTEPRTPPPPPPPPNRPPVTTTAIAPQTILLGGTSTIRVSDHFRDPDGDPLTFTAASSDAGVATASVTGGTLVVTAIAEGTASMVVTARDPEGLSASLSFPVVAVTPIPTTIRVAPDSLVLTALRDTARLSAEVFDQTGGVMVGAPVVWSSKQTTVVRVDSAGLVTAAGQGETTVLATSGAASAEVLVSVRLVRAVTVAPSADSIAPGDTVRLTAIATDGNRQPVPAARFTWSSSHPSIATVNESGLVRGVGEGSATITASSGDVRGTARITVVNPDRAPLIALYEAAGGTDWRNSEGWLGHASLDQWHGVTVNSAGRVIELNLSRNGLEGRIPARLAQLEWLTALRIDGNELAGPLPLDLSRLSLEEFLYADTELCAQTDSSFRAWLDAIPLHRGTGLECVLSDREILVVLYDATGGPDWADDEGWLTDRPLTGWHGVEVDGEGRVTTLSLHHNRLTGAIPPELGSLSHLSVLHVAGQRADGGHPRSAGRPRQSRAAEPRPKRFDGFDSSVGGAADESDAPEYRRESSNGLRPVGNRRPLEPHGAQPSQQLPDGTPPHGIG